MLIQKNNIEEIGSKLVIQMTTGLEIVAELVSSFDDFIEVVGSQRLVQVQSGIGLAPASMLADQKIPTRIHRDKIVSIGVLDAEFEKQYLQAVTNIALV